MFCFYYRYLICRKMDRLEKTNGPKLSYHLSRCAACRQYHDQMTWLDAQMKESACGQLSDAGIRQVKTSVLKALEAFDFKKQPAPLPTRRWPAYAAAACFMIIAGTSGWFSWTHQRNIKDAAAANDAISALSSNVPLLALFLEQPVQQEITELVNGAQQAVVFITNCIPQGPSDTEIIGGQSPETPSP